MSANTVNFDIIGKINACKEQVEGIGPTNQRGVDNALEIANESGVANLIKQVNDLGEVSPELTAAANDLCEVLETWQRQYKDMQEMAGN